MFPWRGYGSFKTFVKHCKCYITACALIKSCKRRKTCFKAICGTKKNSAAFETIRVNLPTRNKEVLGTIYIRVTSFETLVKKVWFPSGAFLDADSEYRSNNSKSEKKLSARVTWKFWKCVESEKIKMWKSFQMGAYYMQNEESIPNMAS